MTYLRTIIREPSTWIGLLIACASAFSVWYFRHDIEILLSGLFTAIVAVVRGLMTDAAAKSLPNLWKHFRIANTTEKSATIITETIIPADPTKKENVRMPDSTTTVIAPGAQIAPSGVKILTKLLTDIPDVIALGEAIAGIDSAYKSGGLSAMFNALEANAPAIEKIISDLKSLGVTEAINAGTVTLIQ